MRIKPFKALRPAPEYAERVACVPYDTVSRSEARRLAAGNPFSLLHVTRAEIDLPDEISPYDDSVYEKARENFLRLRDHNILISEDEPCLYLYRMAAGSHVQTGLMACCHVGDYKRNIIRKHENTRNEKVADRTRLTSTLGAHTGPVLLTYRDQPEIERAICGAEKESPLYELAGSGGATHTIWRIRDSASISAAFESVPVAYIADGHHRAAAALRTAEERGISSEPSLEPEGPWFLAILFPASRLRVLPYNRCVRDLRGMSSSSFLDAVRSKFLVSPNAAPSPERRGHVSMYFEGQWHDLDCSAASPAGGPAAALDVDILQTRLLDPVLGIHDPRADSRIEYVGGDRGAAELKRLVDSGQGAVAFSMFPVAVEQVMAIADAGGIMPPKSTWFDPKPRSGLLIHAF